MKKILYNEILHGMLIIFLGIIAMNGVFRLGAFIFDGTFELSIDAKGICGFLGIFLGIIMCIYHFIEDEEE